ncbi:MAG: CapA family protein, partial [Chloroflexi bacterium]|nr:CapA family protein [Chloroflexota bacterium]
APDSTTRRGEPGRRSSARPPGGPFRSGGPLGGSTVLVGLLAVAGVGLLVGAAVFASGNPGATSGPGASPGPSASGAPGTTPLPGASGAAPSEAPSAAPTDPVAAATAVPLALVADVREVRVGLSAAAVARVIADGRAVVPCGLDTLTLDGETVALDPATCLDAAKITAAVRAREPRYGLLPAGLVTPSIKVLQVGDGDLFGAPSVRARPYPLAATAVAPPDAWTAFDPGEVRTIVSTGDTCPDRGVSHQSNTLGKGWDWVLDGGTAEYTAIKMDRRFDGPDGNGWPVVVAQRTGNEGAVRALISDAEITLNDFECPMTKKFRQHDTGTIFSIDPKVAPLLAEAGVDVVTLASNHMTDQGQAALKETLRLFDKNGIARFGAGLDLEEALEPAVLDVRGVRFAFVGFNEIPGSAKASATTPGVAYLEDETVRTAIAAARKVADVVIVVPQWGWPEYHANFTARQKRQLKLFWEAGADHVVGHGTHWASAVSITKGERGPRFVISSHGNFLFGQDWSRQTQEGVIPELTFVGTTLVQARLHPYIMLDQAQANLTDPVTDGKHVLSQVWDVSILK